MSNCKAGDLEKIYTSKSLINHLLDNLELYYKDEITEFLEPTAGSGNMIDCIKERYTQPILAYDIKNETERTDIIEADFIKLKGLEYKKGRVCIMNPPFSKGLKIMYKCLDVSDYVISILGLNSFLNFNYDKYDVDIIEVIKKQPFEGNEKGFDICIICAKKKKI